MIAPLFTNSRIFWTILTSSKLRYDQLMVRIRQFLGFGGAALANCKKCVVVSMGTGNAIVHFANNSAEHLGGSGVGGETIKGLSSLICGSERLRKIGLSARF